MRLSTRNQIFSLMLALLLAWLGGLFWFVHDAQTLSPPEKPEAVDAIVVLTGGSNRMETGFNLLKEGLGKKLFISGVYRGLEVKTLMKLFKQESSSRLECCVAMGNAENTMENASETAAWLKAENYQTFYLVTANYHMRRALLEFNGAALGFNVIPYPVSPDRLDIKGWWRDSSARGLVLREYSKYLVSLVKYAATV